MNIWRINLKSASINGVNPRQFCLQNNIVGVGWRVDNQGEVLNWEQYYSSALKRYGDKSWKKALNALKNRMKIGDLIWTRDKQNNYYLGRIISNWSYNSEPVNIDADILNIRECEWIKIGTVDSVPGKLVNSFIPASTLQRVTGHSIKLYSQAIFNEHKGEQVYHIKELVSNDIFSLLSSDDCEDLVAMYLQVTEGYYLIPSSCKRSMMGYEFELKHRESGKSAVAQVKNGKVNLDATNYSNLDNEVYLFTTKGKYLGPEKENIHFIAVEEMLQFIKSHKAVLPNKIQFWLRRIQSNTAMLS